jgi:hypothetical protein
VRNRTDGLRVTVVSSPLEHTMTMPSVVATADPRDTAIRTEGPSAVVASGRGRQVLGWLEDAGVLLLLVLAFPLVVLAVGTPVALVVRLLIEIARQWW